MPVFQHTLWGYELTYPEHWSHKSIQDMDAFAPHDELDAGQVSIRGEWNWERQPIEPLWIRHIGKLAGMLGAKQVGSAPWKLKDAVGLEAEIVLPKKDNRRLWTGILVRDFRVLHFMVAHPKESRAQFEPVATAIISSLRFLNRIPGVKTNRAGIPLPPGYQAVDPQSILADISEPTNWHAYAGKAGIGALQAFFLREAPVHNWEMKEYVPFPSSSELGFARLQLQRRDRNVTLGILPYDASGTVTASSPANIVFKVA